MSHLWPQDDDFAVGSPAYDSAVLVGGYMRARFLSNDVLGGSGYGLSAGTWHSAHYLYSGWFSSGVPGAFSSQPAANTLPGGPTNLLGGWIFRAYAAADVEVDICWQTLADSTAIETVERRTHVGVGARLAGSTLSGGGTLASLHSGGNGYFGVLLYEPLSGLGGRFQIWRVVGGTCTLLAQTPNGPTPFNWTDLSVTFVRTMKLKVSGTGATVTLELWASNPSRLTQDLILSTIDSSPSRITAAGRTGFFATGEASLSGIKAAPCVNWFQVAPFGDDPILRDEWTRLNLTAARAISTSLFAGRVLASAWYGDLYAVASIGSILAEDAGGRVTVGAGRDLTLLSQRPAEDSIRQDRAGTFRFATGTLVPNPSVRALGIVLRGAVVTAGQALDSGYRLRARWDDQAGTASILLGRVVGQVETTIASFTGASIALGVDFVLRLVADNSAFPTPATGSVILKAYLDGTQIAFASVGAAGISINGLGTVTDTSTFRVLEGLGEGIHVTNPAASLRRLEIDAWLVGGTIIPVDVDVLDMPSVEIGEEIDGASGTLDLGSSIGAREALYVQDVVEQLDSDHVFRARLGSRIVRRMWDLDFRGATPEAIADFVAFFETHGLRVPYDWTPPGLDEPEIVALFWTDAPTTSLHSGSVGRYAFRVLELIPRA